jgi:Mg2+-importing ATPase
MSRLERTKVIDTVDFDYERKRMSVIIKRDGKLLMITKGAVEGIFSVCHKVVRDGREVRITPVMRKKYEEYAAMGYSVIGLAVKNVGKKKNFTKDDEKGLSLFGFLLFASLPRKTAAHTVSELRKLGVEMKVLTGDGPIVTRKLCNDVGFEIKESRVVLGSELDGMSDEKLQEMAERYNVFARITPSSKYAIVLALRRAGHVVAFMGDGVNDAPAIRAADVGISVNNAVDVAKDAASIILLSSSLEAVLTGIRGGRKIFGNITKYVLNTISANFGNMFSVAASSLFLWFLPLLPSQILLNNLLSDLPMLAISTDNVDSTFLRKPKRWNLKLISDFMVRFGLISVIFDMTMMASLILWLKAPDDEFRTAWFFMSVVSELAVMFSIRTQLSFYKSRASLLLSAMSLVALLATLAVVYLPVGRLFHFVPLGWEYLALTGGVTIIYFITVELTKIDFFRKYGL